jgi:hypothetical protein
MFSKPPFKSVKELNRRVDAYFAHIAGEYEEQETTVKKDTKTKKVYTREAEPPTLTGMALYVGFNSRQDFETHESKGRFSVALKRARLRIETEYEKKLHSQPATGAIFALKSMGWNEKPDKEATDTHSGVLTVDVHEHGPKLASNEQEVEI